MSPQLTEIINLARNGNRTAAFAGLHAYLEATPNDPDAWLALGALARDPDVVRKSLSKALELKPDWPVAQRMLEKLPQEPVEASSIVLPTTIQQEPPSQMRTSVEQEDATTDVSTDDAGAVEVEVIDLDTDVVAPDNDSPDIMGDDAHTESVDAMVSSTPEPEATEDTSLSAETSAVVEARKVYWPFAPTRRKKRPIGELVNQQLITHQDLVWVTEHARNQRVRAAAAALLADPDIKLRSINLSVKDAMQLRWPFKQLNKPLGDLLRAGMLETRDLRRAALFAKDAKLREASRMAIRLNLDEQLPKLPPEEVSSVEPPLTLTAIERTHQPMRIVNGDDYLAHEIRKREAGVRRCRVLTFTLISLAIVSFTAIMVGARQVWYIGVIIAALCGGGVYGLRYFRQKLETQIILFQRGLKAELEVSRYMREYLDDRWTLFRNVKLPGTHTDIDLVLLGPPGVFAIEIKSYRGTFRYKHDSFYRYSGRRWRTMRGNPGKQARATAGILHAYIANVLHSDVWVEPRLVWAGPGALEIIKPKVFVWYMNGLKDEMRRLKHLRGNLSNSKRAMVYGMLSGLSSTHT